MKAVFWKLWIWKGLFFPDIVLTFDECCEDCYIGRDHFFQEKSFKLITLKFDFSRFELWFLLALFLFPPTSHDHQLYGITSGFTRLIMETKYVWHSLISPHVNFNNDRTMWTVTLLSKNCIWGGGGGGGKRAFLFKSIHFLCLKNDKLRYGTAKV